jgi:hypothetical protein
VLSTIFLSFHEYVNFPTGSRLPTKDKPTPKIKQTKPIEVDDSDESSMSSLSDGSQGHLEKSDSDDEDDDNFDVVWMTDREVRQMFNDEVSFFLLGSVLDFKSFVLAAPGCRSRCGFVV